MLPTPLSPSSSSAFESLGQPLPGDDQPRYVALLQWSAGDEAIAEIFDLIEAGIATLGEAHEAALIRMFDGLNWRPHIIAGVAVALGVRTPSLVGAVWGAIDSGSWVSPQLAAVAYLADAEFLSAARRRILVGAKLDPKRVKLIAPHILSAMPGEIEGREGKALSALIHLYKLAGGDEADIAEKLAEPAIVEMLRFDFHEGHRIADRWLARLLELAQKAGRTIHAPIAPRRE